MKPDREWQTYGLSFWKETGTLARNVERDHSRPTNWRWTISDQSVGLNNPWTLTILRTYRHYA
jgi:hypothetical protein